MTRGLGAAGICCGGIVPPPEKLSSRFYGHRSQRFSDMNKMALLSLNLRCIIPKSVKV